MSTPSPQTSRVASCGCPISHHTRASLRVTSGPQPVNAAVGKLPQPQSAAHGHFSTFHFSTRSLLDETDHPVLGSTPRGHALLDLAGPQVLGRALLDQRDELTDPLLVALGDDLDASVAGVACVADEPELEGPRPGPPA